jgi:hypothetical protein
MFAYGLYPNNFPAGNCVDSRLGGVSLVISGQDNIFHGAIYSNGGVDNSGKNNGAPVGDPNGAGFLFYTDPCAVSKPDATHWKGTITERSKPIDWPVPLPVLTCSGGTVGTTCPAGTIATKVTDSSGNTVNCTNEGANWNAPNNLPAGVYCASQKISVGSNENNGSAFIAPQVAIPSSANGTFVGYPGLYNQYGGLYADGYGSGGVQSSAANVSVKGAIFAPVATAKIPGGGTTLACSGSNSCGFIEAVAINFPSNGGTYQGLGPPIGQTTSTTATIVSTQTFTLPGTTSPGSTGTTTVQQKVRLRQ